MKQIQILISILACVFLASCEERTGYYDTDQKEIINLLTGVEWKQTYEHTPNFEPNEFQKEGWVYKFNANGTGSYKWVKWEDGSINGEPVYFRWTFTTDNFAVIYIDKSERFWLIDKLTAKDLWVYNSYQDPVLHPNGDEVFWKFVAQ
ncbi:hypothetical protein [Bacteroides caecimuris]|jgi:hypothetical protein|uniref:hypothetical protein n=1 Tax=Bacteroides caecimuris TaxID=1796613 RepID=UPI00322094C4